MLNSIYKNSKLFIAFVILFPVILFSQEGNSFEGKVQDSLTKKNIEYVSVRLFSSKDSSLVKGDFTDSLGHFILSQLSNGNYYLLVDFFGYDVKKIKNININNSKKDIGVIYLSINKSTSIDEVRIVGKQDAFQIGIDKKVFNVGEDVSTRGGSASDVLIKVPSVDVDQDGKISLRGDGNVTILIDGRPSSMTGGNGKSLLDAIPSSSIERIEVITNPSAKYDPDGTSGIINIVLKKNKLKGTNGMISASGATGNLLNTAVSFSVRNSKVNSYVNYTYKFSEGYRNNWGNLELYSNDVLLSTLKQNRIGMDSNITHSVKIGSDFYLRPNQTIGFSVTGSTGQRIRTGDLTNKFYNSSNELNRLWTRNSYDPTEQQNLDFNFNHKFELKEKKGTFESNITQSLGNADNFGFYREQYYNTDSTLMGIASKDQTLTDYEKNNVLTAQTDFIRIFDKKKSRFETGVKAIVRNLGVNTNSQTMDTISNLYTPDTLSNFIYTYNEQVYSYYAIYGQQKGKWKYQGGLRFEQAFQSPFLVSKDQKFTNNYFNIYPSGHLKYNHKENTEWSLSYSRRVNRAAAEDLNPFTSYADPYNLRMGNPALRPEYINSFDLGYSIDKKKFNIAGSVYFRHTTDVIQRVKIYNSNSSSTVTFANIDQSQSGGLELVIAYKPYKWWRNTISANGSFIKYTDDTENFNYNNQGYNLSGKYVGTFEYWNKTMISQINIQYNAPRITAQGIVQRRGAIELSSEKSLFNGKWSVGLKVSDIFDKQGFTLKVRQPTIKQDSEFKWLTRRVYLTITYKFGKIEMLNKAKTSENSSGSMDF